MKNRDRILFSLPLALGLIIALVSWILYSQTSRFEAMYLEEIKSDIKTQTELCAEVLTPLLESGRISEAEKLISRWVDYGTRITLIDRTGRVAVDSGEQREIMDNHAERPEVKSAFAGENGGAIRYSSSSRCWMIYYAVKIATLDGDYVLRTAVAEERVSAMVRLAESGIFIAVLLGAAVVFFLLTYIMRTIRRPLMELQTSAAAIANGNLATRIAIPSDGLVRELALDISKMAEQLKKQLVKVDTERSEKEKILNAINEGVLLVDEHGDVIRHNTAALAIFPIDPVRPFNLSRSGIPDLIGVVHNTFKTGNDFDREFELERTGGNLTLWIRGGILMVNDRRCLWLAAADITRMKKLESYRSDFVANVSHEIKTPLTSIIGAAEALEGLEDGAEDSPRRKLLDILINQSRRLNLLVQDILSLASLETRQMTPAHDFELLELDSVIINAVNMSLARSGGNCGIEIKVTADAALKVNGDSQLLEQAVVNLIDNAVKYSAASGIEVSLKEEDGYAVIGVIDNGVGIPPEHQRRIFERFYRVHKERSRQSGGTGLGLAIVKHIAQLHNGFVRLVSTPGHGCEFYIHIPLQK